MTNKDEPTLYDLAMQQAARERKIAEMKTLRTPLTIPQPEAAHATSELSINSPARTLTLEGAEHLDSEEFYQQGQLQIREFIQPQETDLEDVHIRLASRFSVLVQVRDQDQQEELHLVTYQHPYIIPELVDQNLNTIGDINDSPNADKYIFANFNTPQQPIEERTFDNVVSEVAYAIWSIALANKEGKVSIKRFTKPGQE